MQPSDKIIWEQCLSGDKDAFKKLYCRYYSALFHYGVRFTPDEDMVKDAIQDIFIKIIQNYRSLSHTPSVKDYLFKALRHTLFDMQKKESLKVAIAPFEESFLTEEFFSLIHLENTEEDFRVKQLMDALKKLSFQQQEIIYLYYVNDLSHEEIAEIMEIKYQSSKNLLFRSLTTLRKIFLKK